MEIKVLKSNKILMAKCNISLRASNMYNEAKRCNDKPKRDYIQINLKIFGRNCRESFITDAKWIERYEILSMELYNMI